MWPISAQGCVDNEFFFFKAFLAMGFSNAGATKPAGAGFRAHVTRYDKGSRRNIYGPNRKDQQAAREALESMRAAAIGMGRDEGFAAMEAEAKRLREGKAPREQGNIEEMDGSYRADIWSCGGGHVHGPRRREPEGPGRDLPREDRDARRAQSSARLPH